MRTQADRDLDLDIGRQLERKDAEIARLRAALQNTIPALKKFYGLSPYRPALDDALAALGTPEQKAHGGNNDANL